MAAALITFKIFIQKKYEPEPKEYTEMPEP